jgi:hypothetical protein
MIVSPNNLLGKNQYVLYDISEGSHGGVVSVSVLGCICGIAVRSIHECVVLKMVGWGCGRGLEGLVVEKK